MFVLIRLAMLLERKFIMKIITPAFNDDTDKVIAVATVLLSLCLLFIPGLLVILLLKEKISESTYQIAKAFLNFELLLFLITLLFLIPVIGWLLGVILGPVLCIFNAIIIVLVLCAIAKGGDIKIPVWYEFI